MNPEEDRVRSLLQGMLSTGEQPLARITPVELRMRTHRRPRYRIDTKAVVAIAAVVVVIVVLLTTGSLKGGRQTTAAQGHRSPSGWIAHSAFGLQVSVPKSWAVELFGQCPDRSKPGTLFIGTSAFFDYCPTYGSDTALVDIYEGHPLGASPQAKMIRVNGLAVQSEHAGAEEYWYVPSRQVILTGVTSRALVVMRTLALATPRAVPAVGQVNGNEYLEALAQAPVSGPITVKRIGSTNGQTVQAVDGSFSFRDGPGNYLLTGHDGNTSCSSVIATVISAQTTNAPPIRCQGE
jgi:hypothetical protein